MSMLTHITTTDYQILAGLFGIAIIIHFAIQKILKIVATIVSKSKTQLDDYLSGAFQFPIKLVVWVVFVYLVISILGKYYPQLTSVYQYLDASIIIIVMIFSLNIIKNFEKFLIHEKESLDNSTIRLFSKLAKITTVVLFTLVFLQFIGINISSVLAFGGVGGLVLGMAAKDMLANIFGGLMISLDKPFSTGDWIRVGKIEGTVEHIGWRTTRVRTFSKNPVYVPNSMFSTDAIETPSRMTNRRIREVVGLRYDDIGSVQKIIDELEIMLKNHPAIDSNALTMVYFQTFNNFSLDLIIYTFTKTKNWKEYQQVKSEILLKIYDVIATNNADIAFPTQTLKLEKEH